MKKLVLLAMSAMLIAFTACNQNNPQNPLPDADKDITDVTPKIDPDQSTTVTVYESKSGHKAILDSICIYNDKGVKVGGGGYVGDYLVPYNGSIQLTYHGYYYETSYGESKEYISETKTDRREVGTAKQMYIAIYALHYGDDWILRSNVTQGKN